MRSRRTSILGWWGVGLENELWKTIYLKMSVPRNIITHPVNQPRNIALTGTKALRQMNTEETPVRTCFMSSSRGFIGTLHLRINDLGLEKPDVQYI